MQLLCLGNIALNAEPARLPAWQPPKGFSPAPGARLMFAWDSPLSGPLTASPRRTGPLERRVDAAGAPQSWGSPIAALANIRSIPAEGETPAPSLLMLQEAGFKTLGAGLSAEDAERPLLWGTAEGELTILDWALSRPAVPTEGAVPNIWPGLFEAGRLIQATKRTSDWVMVVLHWNDAAFTHPRPEHRELARHLSELGADVIIGQHPFGVRGMEFIGSCPVFYGLGSFYSTGAQEPTEPRFSAKSLGVHFSFEHGRPPLYEFVSYWTDRNEVFLDTTQRAFRRMNSASLTLHEHPASVYAEWYEKERARTSLWDTRLQFESLRRGITRRLKKPA